MILCVNANAAIDKTVSVSSFRLNEIHRPQQVIAAAGGKGCNVARALKRLGETPVVTGWVGGFAGQFIEDGLRREGIPADFIHTDFESRTCLSIIDPDNHTLTELYEIGEPVSGDKVEEFKGLLRRTIRNFEAVTLSGSLPPGVPADLYAQVLGIAHDAGVPAFLDGSGEPLLLGAAAKPRLIKPNRQEFTALAGGKAETLAQLAQAAAGVSTRYQTIIVLSLGAEGAIAADRQEILHVRPPRVTIKSAVGSGDCLLAGVAYGLTHGLSLANAVRHGVAAGTANALTLGAGVFSRNAFEDILSQVTAKQLNYS